MFLAPPFVSLLLVCSHQPGLTGFESSHDDSSMLLPTAEEDLRVLLDWPSSVGAPPPPPETDEFTSDPRSPLCLFVLSQCSHLTSIPPSSHPLTSCFSSSAPGPGPGPAHHCSVSPPVPQVNQRRGRHTRGRGPASPYGLAEKNLFLQDESASASRRTKNQGSPGTGPLSGLCLSAGTWTSVKSRDWRTGRGHEVTRCMWLHSR